MVVARSKAIAAQQQQPNLRPTPWAANAIQRKNTLVHVMAMDASKVPNFLREK
jgi:hypothetical protein